MQVSHIICKLYVKKNASVTARTVGLLLGSVHTNTSKAEVARCLIPMSVARQVAYGRAVQSRR